VLLPVRNAAPWLAASLASLGRQSEPDFEIVAVDDGSTDASAAMLRAHAAREPRLRVLPRPHEGLPAALQTAFAAARGEVLMRHDADDLSHRERLARQLAFLDAHPEVDVVGSRLRLFPHGAYGQGMRRWATWHDSLLTHEEMQRERLIDSPLCHGTALLRRAALERVAGWQERGWAEDLDLWVRMFEAGVRFAKLPQRLYSWRQHPASSTRNDPRYARERFTDLKRAALGRWLGSRRATLVGNGASLARWREALGPMAAACVQSRGPRDCPAPDRETPWVLVVTASAARTRWRVWLISCGMVESRDFIFIA
jgi:glycosyltransferase involved in cell wall biosynthesis